MERQGAGVVFSVLCKIWLGTISMLCLELMFFFEVFKSERTEQFGTQLDMTRQTVCRLSFRQNLCGPWSTQGFGALLHSPVQ